MQSHSIKPINKLGNVIKKKMKTIRGAKRCISAADGRLQRINYRNNCRHEESFKPTSRDTVWRGYTLLERVSPDTRDIIYGDSYGPGPNVYYTLCKCIALGVHRATPQRGLAREMRFMKNELGLFQVNRRYSWHVIVVRRDSWCQHRSMMIRGGSLRVFYAFPVDTATLTQNFNLLLCGCLNSSGMWNLTSCNVCAIKIILNNMF